MLRLFFSIFAALFFIWLGICSLVDDSTFLYVGRSVGRIDVVQGLQAKIMGVGWFGVALAIFSKYFLSSIKINSEENKILTGFGVIVFAMAFFLVTTIHLVRVFSPGFI